MVAASTAPYAAMANAVKANGVVVRVEPDAFLSLLRRVDTPLVVVAHGGFWKKRYRYLTSVKGLAFYTESADALSLSRADVVSAWSIAIPDL